MRRLSVIHSIVGMVCISVFTSTEAVGDACDTCTGGIDGSISFTCEWQTVSGQTGAGGTNDVDQVFSFAAVAGQTYIFSTCQGGGTASYDTGLTVSGQSCSAIEACNDDNFAACGLFSVLSQLSWQAPATGTHVIRVGGFFNATGSFTLAYRRQCCVCGTDLVTDSAVCFRDVPCDQATEACASDNPCDNEGYACIEFGCCGTVAPVCYPICGECDNPGTCKGGFPECTNPFGACCILNGECFVQSEASCNDFGGIYSGDGTVCDPNTCPVLGGACCFTDGNCALTSIEDCCALEGIYRGDGSSCEPNTCPGVEGACCFTTGDCSPLPVGSCCELDGIYLGDHTTCEPNTCPGSNVACCFSDGNCSPLTIGSCRDNGGVYQRDLPLGASCDPNTCPGWDGACCFGEGDPNGDCSPLSLGTCNELGGTYHGIGTECSEALCDTISDGACCFPSGECTDDETVSSCSMAGGAYAGDGTDCSPNPCPGSGGACCFSDGTCSELNFGDCETADGVYRGDGTDCDPNTCLGALGACCLGDGTCSDGSIGDCCDQSGVYQGDGTSCASLTCLGAEGACCLSDQSCSPLSVGDCCEQGGVYHGDDISCDSVVCVCDGPEDCDDGNFCNGVERCVPGDPSDTDGDGCVDGRAPTCEDGLSCTADSCDSAAPGCAANQDTESCCTHTPVDCSDGIECTVDTCEECDAQLDPDCEPDGHKCVHTPDDASCQDGDACTTDTCESSDITCLGNRDVAGCCHTPVDCSDDIECTIDACEECDVKLDPDCEPDGHKCVHTPDDAPCQDGDACNGEETCDPELGCQPGDPIGQPVGCGAGFDPTARIDTTQKGSLLIFSKVEIKWDAAGNLIQDTFLDFSNDYPAGVSVQAYFINGDIELAEVLDDNDEVIQEFEPGWNTADCRFALTANQPHYWSAANGSDKCQPFDVLDEDGPGRPDPETGGATRILRGYVIMWAVRFNAEGNLWEEIRWNHLKGDAVIVNYEDGTAWEYNAWAAQARCGAHGEPLLDCIEFDENGVCCDAEVIPGNLDLDGFQYDVAFDTLLLDFYGTGSTVLSGGGVTASVNTDLTVHAVDADLRQDGCGPVLTKVEAEIWNEFESKFSGTRRCICCWDQTLLSDWSRSEVIPNHFRRSALRTDKGKARLDGVYSTECDYEELCGPTAFQKMWNCGRDSKSPPYSSFSQDAAILGLATKFIAFSGGVSPQQATAGMNLVGTGHQRAHIEVDAGNGETEEARSEIGVGELRTNAPPVIGQRETKGSTRLPNRSR